MRFPRPGDMEAAGSGRHRYMDPYDLDQFDDMPSHDAIRDFYNARPGMGHGGMDDWDDSSSMEDYGGMSSLGMSSLYMDDRPGRGHGYMGHHEMDHHEMGHHGIGHHGIGHHERGHQERGHHERGHSDMDFHSRSDGYPSRSGRHRGSAHGLHRSRSDEWDDAGPIEDRIYEMH